MNNNLFLGDSERNRVKNFSNSSTVLRAEYDYITRKLVILFTTGTTYEYSGIPEEIVDKLWNAESPGKTLNIEIKKGAYSFIKVQPPEVK